MRNSKKPSGSVFRFCILVLALAALAFSAGGCRSYAQPGETEAEGHRRHKRILAINKQEMMADIDAFMMFDEPSKLSGKRIH